MVSASPLVPSTGGLLTLFGSDFGDSSWVDSDYQTSFDTAQGPWGGCTRVDSTHITCSAPAGVGAAAVISLAMQRDVAAAQGTFAYAAPVVTAAVLPHGASRAHPAGAGALLSVYGSNFGPATQPGQVQVSVGGTACPVTRHLSDSVVLCAVPAGQGSGRTVLVTVGGQTGPSAETIVYLSPVAAGVKTVLAWEFVNVTVSEGDGTVMLTLVRYGSVQGSHSVQVSLQGPTAYIDFDGRDRVLDFASGVRDLTLAIDLADNDLVDGERTFTVKAVLVSGNSAAVDDVYGVALITIQDNDVARIPQR